MKKWADIKHKGWTQERIADADDVLAVEIAEFDNNRIRYERDEEGWWVAQSLDHPEAITQGRTLGEARDRIWDALEVAGVVHPVVASLATAPVSDEPLTDEDRKAIDEGRAESGGMSTAELRRRLGLT